jgi:hypothetical protein
MAAVDAGSIEAFASRQPHFYILPKKAATARLGSTPGKCDRIGNVPLPICHLSSVICHALRGSAIGYWLLAIVSLG